MREKGPITIFTRLITYFLIVMIIPLIIVVSTLIYYNTRDLSKVFEEQALTTLNANRNEIEDLFLKYKHIIYEISADESIQSVLGEDELDKTELSKKAYFALYSAMAGEEKLAEASIVSTSGKVRLSTHVFPELYDLRINSNEWNQNSIFYSMRRMSDDKNTLIMLQQGKTNEDGKAIFATLMRSVKNKDGQNLGFVIIDIYTDTLVSVLYKSSLFSSEVLVDNTTYVSLDLLQPYQALYTQRFSSKDRVYTYPSLPLLENSFQLEGTIDASAYQTSQTKLILMVVGVLTIGILISLIFAFAFSRSISKRISEISGSMKSVASGNLSASIDKKTLGRSEIEEFSALADSFNSMTIRLKELMDLTREEEEKLREAERKELEQQLNPHFLFNTLNTIKALASLHHEDEIYTISIKLSYLLRNALKNHSGECTIRESLELTESYLMIQKIRFKDKISYKIICDEETLDEMAPRLIIQPFVENAIIHGLEPKTEPGHVEIRVRNDDRFIYIEVEDNGVGFDSSPLENNMKMLARSEHVGMYNVYRRLEMKYGDELKFSINSKIGEGTLISISFPMEEIDEL